MAITLNYNLYPSGDPLYYDKSFRRFLESYISYFKSLSTTLMITVNPHDVLKYRGDFYGLLDTFNIERPYHWFIMRLNNINDPLEVPETLDGILIPDLSKVSKLKQLYSSTI